MARKEQGTTGLSAWAGTISEEFLRELRGREGIKRFEEMRRNSPVVGAMLYYHEMAVRKVSWNFQNTADPKAKDERIDFLNYARENMTQSWTDAVSEWLSFLWAGFALSYPLYKRDKQNKIIWDAFSPRKQNTVYQWILNFPGQEHYDPRKHNGATLGFIQSAPPSYKMETIYSEDLLHFRTKPEAGNPEGISLLRQAWIPYYYTKNLQATEGIAFERDTNGLPVITLPQGANVNVDDENSDANRAAEIVRNIRNDEQSGIVLPFGYVLSLLSGAGKSFADLGKAIERYESRTLMAMLSQFLMLGQNGVGSYSLSGDQTDIAVMIVNVTADIVADTFTKQELPRILKLNGYDPEGIILNHSPAGETDVIGLADFLQKVQDRITWSAEDEQWLRQAGGLPERDPAEIEADMAEREAAKEQAQQEFLQRAGQGQGKKPMKPGMDMKPEMEAETDEHHIAMYAAGNKPPDERLRLRKEREYNETMARLFDKQKRRLMKWAREQKGI